MSCGILDCDQTFTVHDFGPTGFKGPVTLNLKHGLKPGGSISVVVTTDHEWNFTLFDDKSNILYGFGARIHKNVLACNTRLNNVWGTEILNDDHKWKKGIRVSFCFLSDVDTYRVYVNGQSVFVFPHRVSGRPSTVELANNGLIYKVVYNTAMDIIP